MRKENEYIYTSLEDRRKLFDRMLTFTRTCGITYASFVIRKKEYPDRLKMKARLSREISLFLSENMERFVSFDHVIAYYDNGQAEITELINNVFGATFFDVEFRKVIPSDYRLFQCADLLCTLELLRAKDQHHEPLSRSEEIFFESRRRLRKDYLKTVDRFKLN